MKSFLDRFRRKDGEEPASEAEASPAPKSGKPENLSKYAGARPGRTTTRIDTTASAGQEAETAEDAQAQPKTDEALRLEVGDFIHRIPTSLLKEGPHDLAAPLLFDLDVVANRVARGETTISMQELQKQAPQIFKPDAMIGPDQEVRFPWQKVLKLLDASKAAKAEGEEGDTLALKLKQRQVNRNIGGTKGGAEAAPAGDAAKAAPIIRGGGGRGQVSWFSRTAGTEGSAPAGAPAEATPTATSAPAPPAIEPPPSATAIAPEVETGAPSANPASQPAPAEAAAPLKLVLPEPAPEKSQSPAIPLVLPDNPAPAASPTPQKPAAAAPQGFGEEPDRNELLRARDSALAQMARAKADFERQLNAAAQERQQALEHRDKALLEFESFKKGVADQAEQREFDQSVAEKATANLEKAAREREALEAELKAIRAERATLQQQLSNLSKVANEPTLPVVSKEAGRSQKEYQRQIEELNRRIQALEGNQKERTQEIVKEREARSKVERQLSAAERSLEESSRQMETTRIEARQQVDGELKKKESEIARLRDESHREAEKLRETNEQLATERDEIAAKLRDAQAQVETAQADAWNDRAAAQFEADIENYRARIKTLLQERDTALQEKESFAAEAGRLHETGAKARDEAALATLTEQVTALTLERDQAAKGQGELRTRLETAEKRLSQDGEAQQKLTGLEQQLAAQKQVATAAEKERADALAELQKLKAERSANVQAAETNTTENNTIVTRLRQDGERAMRDLEQAHAESQKLMAQLNSLQDERRQEREKQERERNAASQSADRSTAALRKAIDTQQKAIAALTKERDDLAGGREAVLTELNQARAEQRRISGEMHKLRDELLADQEKIAADLGQARSVAESSVATLTKERDTLREEHEQATAKLKELQEQSSRLPQQLESLKRESREEQEALSAQITAAYQARDEFRAQHDEVAEDLAKAQSQLSLVEKDLEQLRRHAQGEREHLQSQLAGAITQRSTLSAELEEAAKKLQAELTGIQKHHDELKASHTANQARATGLEAELASTRSAHEQNIAEHEKTLSALRQENETRLTSLENEHREALKAASASESDLLAQREKTIADLREEARRADEERVKLTTVHEQALEKIREESQRTLHELGEKHAEALKHTLGGHGSDLAARDKQVEDLRTELAQSSTALNSSSREIDLLRQEHQSALKKLEEDHRQALDSAASAAAGLERQKLLSSTKEEMRTLRTEHAKALEAIKTETQGTLGARESEYKATIERLENEAKKQIEALEGLQRQEATLTAKHTGELAAVRNAHTEELAEMAKKSKAALASKEKEHAAALARKAAEQESASATARTEAAAALDAREKQHAAALARQAAEAVANTEALKKEAAESLSQKESALSTVTGELAAAKSEVTKLGTQHAEQLEMLKAEKTAEVGKVSQERDVARQQSAKDVESARQSVAAGETRIAALADEIANLKVEIAEARKAFTSEKDELVRSMTVEKLGQIAQKDADIEQREKTMANMAIERDNALAEMRIATEAFVKDRELMKADAARAQAEQAAKHERAASDWKNGQEALEARLGEREKTIGELSANVSRLEGDLHKAHQGRQQLEEQSRAELASMAQQRDQANASLATLREQMTAEAKRAADELQGAVALREKATQEKFAMETTLREARESHDSENTALSKEFRQMIRQRDEALARLEGERQTHQQQIETLEQQRSEKGNEEAGVRLRLEQDVTRLREENEAAVRERDELRKRMARLLDHQREFLAEVGGAPAPNTSQPRSQPSRSYSVPPPEPVPVNPSVYVMPRSPRKVEPMRKAEAREYVEAELVHPPETESGLKLNPVRPMPVRPPRVQPPI